MIANINIFISNRATILAMSVGERERERERESILCMPQYLIDLELNV